MLVVAGLNVLTYQCGHTNQSHQAQFLEVTHRHDALKKVVMDTTEMLVEETNEGTFGEAPCAVLQTHGMGAIYSDEVEFILRRNVRGGVDPRVVSCCLLCLGFTIRVTQ